MRKEIDNAGNVWLRQMEIDDYLNDPANPVGHLDPLECADLMADIGEQLATDEMVDDSFREAISHEPHDFNHNGDLDDDSWLALRENLETVLDLCDIVEATENGHIIYG